MKGSELSAKLFSEYERAARTLRRDINDFYGRYATRHGLTYDQAVRTLTRREAQEWRATLGEYVDRINAATDPKVKAAMVAQLDALSANSQISRMEALLGQTQLTLNDLYDRCTAQLQDEFGGLYEVGYYRKHYDLQSRAGWLNEVAKLDIGLVESAVNYPWSGATFSDRLWRNKEVLLFNMRELLTQSVIQGKGLAETSKALAGKMGQSYKAAERLVRTETSHLHNEADKAAYLAAGVEEYEFVATLDARTCEVCGGLDGKHFKLSKALPGENYPPMHPNDRCTTVEYDPEDRADWAASGERMPENMTYEEWARRAVGGVGQGAGGDSGAEPGIVVQTGTVKFSDKEAVLKQMELAREEFYGLGLEMNRTVTADGKVWTVTGSAGAVNPWGIEKQGSSLKGSFSYHNHPKKMTWYSFSEEDIRFFFASGEEYSAAADHLYRYTMRRTAFTLDVSGDEVYYQFRRIHDTDVLREAMERGLDMDMDGYHETMLRLSKKYSFFYERRRLDGSE